MRWSIGVFKVKENGVPLLNFRPSSACDVVGLMWRGKKMIRTGVLSEAAIMGDLIKLLLSSWRIIFRKEISSKIAMFSE